MPRIVKDYDERYNEFLDAAQQLFFTQGYEQTSVKQIIDAVGVAKGTFYHYFTSKVEILEALVRRIVSQTAAIFEDIVAAERLTAPEKLLHFFTQVNQWYIANQEAMLLTVRIIYHDENVLLREKMYSEMNTMFVPLLEQVIKQGMADKTFDVEHSLEVAEIVWMMIAAFDQSFTRSILSGDPDATKFNKMKRELAVFNTSMARVLGMPAGALKLIDVNELNTWFKK